MTLKFKKLNPLAKIPRRAHKTDSGLDIRATEGRTLYFMERHTFTTGLAAVIPEGYEIQVRPRSGLAKKGVVAMFGTVDQSYRGEIGITLINFANEPITISIGDRIAQLVLSRLAPDFDIIETNELDETDRGTSGFGSTGRT